MISVYDHFARNLSDIITPGSRSGAGIVVSTVAVNLKDCAPFASAHRPGLCEADKAKWEQLYRNGINAQAADKIGEAAEWYREAAQIDDVSRSFIFVRAGVRWRWAKPPERKNNFRPHATRIPCVFVATAG